MSDLFAIRPAAMGDVGLVIDSFWRDFRHSIYAEGLSVATMRHLIIDVMGQADWKTVIAEMPDVPGEIYGWMVYRNEREVAWLYVKAAYRKNGCARAMLAHAGVAQGRVACAFLDPKVVEAARGHGYQLVFRPFVTAVPG